MGNKYFSMTNINTKEMVTYTIYDDYIEAITNDNSMTRFSKNNKYDNKVIMDLINNLINQGCIINEMNII
ncbi:TPA: hypothetical protein N2D16_002858 [Clostridium botulinum]|nr:hypothetical protein [Clostridium botulinum]HCL4455234.1 hypothetical protein [Clostridium botulinum]